MWRENNSLRIVWLYKGLLEHSVSLVIIPRYPLAKAKLKIYDLFSPKFPLSSLISSSCQHTRAFTHFDSSCNNWYNSPACLTDKCIYLASLTKQFCVPSISTSRWLRYTNTSRPIFFWIQETYKFVGILSKFWNYFHFLRNHRRWTSYTDRWPHQSGISESILCSVLSEVEGDIYLGKKKTAESFLSILCTEPEMKTDVDQCFTSLPSHPIPIPIVRIRVPVNFFPVRCSVNGAILKNKNRLRPIYCFSKLEIEYSSLWRHKTLKLSKLIPSFHTS